MSIKNSIIFANHHNSIFNNGSQVSDVGGNNWLHPVDNTGNYWSNYWGKDDGSNGRTAGDFIGDTELPHEGVDANPLLDPSIPQLYGAFCCDDWWVRGSWLIWRGGWSPVTVQATDNLGRTISGSVKSVERSTFNS